MCSCVGVDLRVASIPGRISVGPGIEANLRAKATPILASIPGRTEDVAGYSDSLAIFR